MKIKREMSVKGVGLFVLRSLLSNTMTAKRTFVCPKMCGCEFEIEAEWVKKTWADWIDPPRISYQHPVPGTIKSLRSLHVCPEHRGLQAEAVPFDPYAKGGPDGGFGYSAGYILPPYRFELRVAAEATRRANLKAELDAMDDGELAIALAVDANGERLANSAPAHAWRENADVALAAARAAHQQWEPTLSPDGRLYVHLFRYVGNKETKRCGCSTYRWVNWYDASIGADVFHPVHERECWWHAAQRKMRKAA